MATLTKNYALVQSTLEAKAHKGANAKAMDTSDFEKVVAEKVDRVLSSTNYSEKRARTLDVDDFIKLLLEFNKEGVHFA